MVFFVHTAIPVECSNTLRDKLPPHYVIKCDRLFFIDQALFIASNTIDMNSDKALTTWHSVYYISKFTIILHFIQLFTFQRVGHTSSTYYFESDLKHFMTGSTSVHLIANTWQVIQTFTATNILGLQTIKHIKEGRAVMTLNIHDDKLFLRIFILNEWWSTILSDSNTEYTHAVLVMMPYYE